MLPAIDRSHASPNHGERKAAIDMLVLHYTGMKSEDGALHWLCNPASEVSAHYVVREDGRIHQLVAEERRAWHAGRSAWRGLTDLNSHSIGIEICNPGHEFGYRPFPKAQIDAVIALCRDILQRHPIPAVNIVAHSDIAPTRKEDPGELFPFDRLAGEGIGLWLPAADGSDESIDLQHEPHLISLQEALAEIGYPIEISSVYDDLTRSVITAFQRRFRQHCVDGKADPGTLATVEAVRALFARHSP